MVNGSRLRLQYVIYYNWKEIPEWSHGISFIVGQIDKGEVMIGYILLYDIRLRAPPA